MDDKQIIALFESRSQDAILETKRKYDPLCRALAGKLLRSEEDVEECLADTYLALWNAIPPARPGNLAAYIAKTIRNLALDRLAYTSAQKRRGTTVALQELEGVLHNGGNPEQVLGEKELAESIRRFLETQDPESRDMFLRRYWFFDSIDEISKRFAVSASGVKNRLYRIRKKLKEHLVREGFMYE
jgi:RNA polymerase sigma-70 factor (ECF subfamily)